MSQAGINNSSVTVNPSIPTSFVVDIGGPSIPIANVEQIRGGVGISTSAVGNVITITNTGIVSNLTFNTDSGSATEAANAITFHGAGGLLFSGAGSTVTGTLANIPNSSLAHSSITLSNGSNITVTGSPVSLGGTATIALNSQIQQPNGVVGAPPYSWSTDPTSGMYFTAGVVHFSIGGSDVLSFGNTSATFTNNILYVQSVQMGGGLIVNTNVQSASYNVQTYDYFIGFDTSGGAYTLTLRAAPNTGQYYIVKDVTGHAAANNITIAGNGKNIDGAASYLITVNHGSVGLIYDGTEWNII